MTPDGRYARLKLREHPLVDTFQIGGPLAITAQLNIEVRWTATSDPVERGKGAAVAPESPAAFTAHFAEARAVGRISGVETGFSFKSDELTAADFFAEMGREQNGDFLG